MVKKVPQVVNIAAYKFISIAEADLLGYHRILTEICSKLLLKGTIVLSPEGINLFVAGSSADVTALWSRLTAYDPFADMEHKRSLCAKQPFRRLKIRIKDQIIPGGTKVQPDLSPRKRIEPSELKCWLDERRDFTLLDTRNDYEIRFGTFKTAENLEIGTFVAYNKAIDRLPVDLKSKPLVLFCTGGIRCEKAAPMMAAKGFQDVYQLEGGILKYFDECTGAHYAGECFVFDDRISLYADLRESGTVQCAKCFYPIPTDTPFSDQLEGGTECSRCSDSR